MIWQIFSLCTCLCTVQFTRAYQWNAIYLHTFLQNVNDEVQILEMVTNVDILKCINHCQRRNICQFINYHRLIRMCFLLEQVGGSLAVRNVVSKAHFVFGDKTEWTDDYTSCDICSPRELCTHAGDGSILCTKEECPAPAVKDGASMYGNSYTIGSRLLYQCSNNSAMSGSVVCQTDGTWSSTDVSCLSSVNLDGHTNSTTTAQTTTQIGTTEQTTTPIETTEQTTTLNTSTEQATTTISLGYQEVTLTDYTRFKFLVVTQLVNQSTALQLCIDNYRGTLVKILTAAKIEFLMNYLNTNGDENDFWIDAYRRDGNYPWLTSDGQAVLTDSSYWRLGGQDVGDPCTRMHHQYNYRLNDRKCHIKFAFVCEQ